MFQLALILPMLFNATPAHAWAAASMEARCSNGMVEAVLPFTVSQPDGFYFDDSSITITIGNEPANYGPSPAIVLSQATSERFKMRPGQFGYGAPNLFTLQSKWGKLGFIIRTNTLVSVGKTDTVVVERFNSRGQSLGVQAIACEVFGR